MANGAKGATIAAILCAVCGMAATSRAAVTYKVDDGTSEIGVGIDPGEDSIWLNTFPVQSGGEVINSISVAYGRAGVAGGLNGLPVSILLYEDIDGGSPANAVLKQKIAAVVANGNTNTLNNYATTPTTITGSLVVGVLYRNRTEVNKFIAAADLTAPTVPGTSWTGFTGGDMNENDLSTIPGGQFGELGPAFGIDGNFIVRATGTAVPEPSSAAALAAMVSLGAMRRRSRPSG